MSGNQVGIFVGGHRELSAERIAIARALHAFDGGFRMLENANDSSIYMGLFGQQYDEDAVQAYSAAKAAGKQRLIFVKQTRQRDPGLDQFLKQISDAQPQSFDDPAELTTLVIRLIEKMQADLFPGWRIAPLPPRDRYFAGRETDIQTLTEMLTNGTQPAVILSGSSGIGKSALALEMGYRLRGKFPGGIFWLPRFGSDGDTLEQVWRRLANVHPVGRVISAESRPLRPEEILGWLIEAPGRVLLIADDIQDAAALLQLQQGLPENAALLATTPISMERNGWQNHTLDALTETDAVTLLRNVLNVPAHLSVEMIAPLEEVARMLHQHPLSLRLATHWLRRMGGWQAALLYIKRYSETENMLENLKLNNVTRYPYAEKAFSLIYKTLTSVQRTLFKTAAVFAPGTIQRDRLMLLAETTEGFLLEAGLAGLLVRDDMSGGYRVHDLIRSYALALLEHSGEAVKWQGKHFRHYLRQAEQHIHEQQPTPDSEISQYRAAFHHAVEHQERDVLLKYVMTAGQWLYMQQQYHELKRWLKVTLNAAPSADDRPEIPMTLRALGDLSARIQQHDLARGYYEKALLIYYQQKSLSGQANTLKVLGDLCAREGKVTEAQDYYDRTLQLYAQIDFQLGRANTLKALGDLSIQGSDLPSAADYYHRTLALYEQIDFQLGQGNTLKALGDLAVHEHQWLNAQDYLRRALAIFREIRFHAEEAATLTALGDLQMQLNTLPAAQNTYEEALTIYQKADNAAGQLASLKTLGKLHEQNHRMVDAAIIYQQGIELAQEADLKGEEGIFSELLGIIRLEQKEYPEATRLLTNALNIFTELNIPRHVDEVRLQLRKIAQQTVEGFPVIWSQASAGKPMPDWLRKTQHILVPQELVYAVRDFMIADNWTAAQRIVEKHRELMMTDAADEVFARMLRQYAGQPNPTRQIDKYRALLQRCRQIGIEAAFAEIQAPATTNEANRAARLVQSLDAYVEALTRLQDMPLVYASIQINRASTLRELAALPEQDRIGSLRLALEAYNEALERQRESAPLDYASTQVLRAEVLRELCAEPGQDKHTCLQERLAAYEAALVHQRTIPADYAKTQILRAETLHELANAPGEVMSDRIMAALEAYDDALTIQEGSGVPYARTQSRRAKLLYDMAGLPGQDFNARMGEALTAYDEALEFLRDEDSLEYARTQSNRVALLRDMAGLPGEDRTARLYQALAAANEALRYLHDTPIEYARTQINRAHLLREIAGLTGEHRLARMREALATYNEVLDMLHSAPLDYVMAQNSRASLLKEMANLSGENRSQRLRQVLEVSVAALDVLENLANEAQLRTARRMVITTRKEVVNSEGEGIFERWWEQITANKPIPAWIEE